MKKLLLVSLLAIAAISPAAEAKQPSRYQRKPAPVQLEPQEGLKMEVAIPSAGRGAKTRPRNTYATKTQSALKTGLVPRISTGAVFMRAEELQRFKASSPTFAPQEAKLGGGSEVKLAGDFVSVRDDNGTTLIKLDWPLPENIVAGADPARKFTDEAAESIAAVTANSKEYPHKVEWNKDHWVLVLGNERIPLVKDRRTERRALPVTDGHARLGG